MRRRGQMDSKRAGEAVRPANARAGIGGVPGSDMCFVPGIRLTDPMKQGIGAVTRKVQRLFGVTNHHCIDVDVWRHLTPQELSARGSVRIFVFGPLMACRKAGLGFTSWVG
jgi:hypothetical protein